MQSHLIALEGNARGGTLGVRVFAGDGVADLMIPTIADRSLRLIAQDIYEQLATGTATVPLYRVDLAGALLLVVGADSVETSSDDAGLSILAELLPEAPLLSPVTDGGVAAAQGGPTSADEQVLDHLARMVGALKDSSAASARLMNNVLAAHRTYTQAALAHLTGTPLPVEPNPGNGGTIQLAPAATQAVLASLGETNRAMMDAVTAQAGSAAAQLGAVARKEAEAKGGAQPGGVNPPAGGGGKQLPGDVPPGQPSGGGAPAGGGKPGKPAGGPTGGGPGGGGPGSGDPPAPDQQPNETVAKPVGSDDDEYEVVERPCQTYIYTVRGMVYRVGRFHDGTWAMSSGPKPVEVVNALGEHRVIDSFEVYDIDFDKDAFDAWVERIRQEDAAAAAAAKKEADRWVSGEILSFALSMVPVLGELKTVLEGLVGVDLVTFEALDDETRALYLLTALIASPIGTRLFKKLGAAAKSTLAGVREAIEAEGVVKLGAEARAAVEEAERAAAEVRAATEGRGVETITNACEESAQISEHGSTLERIRCFPAGTTVWRAGGDPAPIEAIRRGAALLAAKDARRNVPTGLAAAAGEVVRASRSRARELVGLRLGGADILWATPWHALATPGGYVRAADLEPGDHLVSLKLGALAIEAISRRRCDEEVFNFEVAEHHSYVVGPQEILVHNACWENKSQGRLTRLLEKADSGYIVKASEPEMIAGKRLSPRRTMQTVKREIATYSKAIKEAEAVGRPFEEIDALKEKLGEIYTTARCTYPDLVIDEVKTGRRVALELKTIAPTKDIIGQFRQYATKYDYQRWLRRYHLPKSYKNVLVIDISLAEGSRLERAAAGERVQIIARMEAELKFVFRELGDDFTAWWKEVRFMVPGADGPQLLPPIAF